MRQLDGCAGCLPHQAIRPIWRTMPDRTDSIPPWPCCRCALGSGPRLSRRAFVRGLAASGATVALADCDQVDVGWLARMLVPPEAEAELGRQAFRQIMSETPVAQDPGLHEYVTRVGARIVHASNSPHPDWQFVVFESDQANAFALPGGRVGVFTGMLQVAADEAQLATVLGHEVGHVNARHGAERMVTEHFIALGLRFVAALLAFGDVQIPPDLLVALGASAAELGIVRPFSRTQELEADALGLDYMAQAGYEPTAAIAFWRRMQQLSGDGGPPDFLATHPSSARRIEELLERLPELESGAALSALETIAARRL
jgi:predicted Zn-dependent protease